MSVIPNQSSALKSLLVLVLFGVLTASTAFLHDYVQNQCVAFITIDLQIDRRKKFNDPSPTCLCAVQDEGIVPKFSSNIPQSQNETDSAPISVSPRIPYVIQKIGRGNKREIDEITRLCIDVFFNEQTENAVKTPQRMTPWKAVQLAYLRNSQAGDILTRNAFRKNQLVDIIVARRVYRVMANEEMKNAKFIQQSADQIYNKEELSLNDEVQTKLVLGDVIGYCEVIEKNFGLGDNISSGKPLPYLANLSVSKFARQSGVGSKLLEVSEEVVRDWNVGHTRMVLQVEEDNTDAIQFYKKRGWEFVYADPTCRRFDTSGFFLKESRITKYAMVKQLETNKFDEDKPGQGKQSGTHFQKLKDLWFVSQ
jgi:ribosomal protein S18 acetylase RimI-like enzyme